MKAAVTSTLGAGFKVQELTLDTPIGHEVLVSVKGSGLCASDLHLATVDFGTPLPAVFGHEIAGIVAQVGPDVVGIHVGDHVVACLIQYCGRCRECLAGRTYACVTDSPTLRPQNAAPRLRLADGRVNQVYGIGGFADTALVHENQLAVVNNEIPFAQAALLGCATVTGAGAAINSAQVRVGDTVAVIGTGGVGLNVISGARVAGAIRIIAMDIDDQKLAQAVNFGATDTINTRDRDAAAEVRRLTGGGVRAAFEVVGSPATQAAALDMVEPGGGVYFVGLAKPGSTVQLSSSLPMLRAHSAVVGVHMGSTNLKRDIPLYADLYVQGRFNLDDLVSQEIGIGDIDEAYEQLGRGGVIRSVVTDFS